MSRPVTAYLHWVEEEVETSAGPRPARVAWLVCDAIDETGTESRRFLAYLGRRPAITPQLIEELTSLYPELAFDWPALRRAVAEDEATTDVGAMTDDELALGLRRLAGERGLSLPDLSLRLGYRQRHLLPELLRFLEDTGTVARFERTSGSIFDYLVERHLDYAFLIYKARLFFAGQQEALQRLIAGEPAGFGGAAWRARRRFWRQHLDAYRAARRSGPPTDPAPSEDAVD